MFTPLVTVDLDVPIPPPLFGGLPWQRHVEENNANSSLYSESIFPPFEHMNQPPLETTMAHEEFNASMANPFYDYNPPSSESPLSKTPHISAMLTDYLRIGGD